MKLLSSDPLFCRNLNFIAATNYMSRNFFVGRHNHPKFRFSSSSDVFDADLLHTASSTCLDGNFRDDGESSLNDDDVMLAPDFMEDNDYSLEPISTTASVVNANVSDDDGLDTSNAVPLNAKIYNDNLSVYPTAGYVPRKGSIVEQRVSAQQLPYMEQVTQHLISQKSYKTVEVSEEKVKAIFGSYFALAHASV
jgi:hypothetical protein